MPVSSLYSGSGVAPGAEVIAELLPESPSGVSNGSANENRAVKLALELALLQGGGGGGPAQHGGSSSSLSELPVSSAPPPPPPSMSHHHLLGHSSSSSLLGGSLEDLKMRRSQNMTECVPVPSSEHVAEIVGRQGCKIKALRAKTNTYIKTPVRGDEPVFVVTGRKEDVSLAKREILSAAEHFSQIRASRKNQINSTLAFGQMVANSPGQTTTQVRVPYRVVGLVVGPKGATIKRIQQTTHTYIVTPSRDKEPVFEVTGLPENVDAARKEIEAHIAIRTGVGFLRGGEGGELNNDNNSPNNNFELPLDNHNSNGGFSNGYEGPPAPSYPAGRSVSPHNSSSILNNDHFTASLTNKTLQHLLDEQHHSNGINISGNLLQRSSHPVWSGTDSHDSGIGHSPPFDSLGSSHGGGMLLGGGGHHGGALTSSSSSGADDKMAGIWGELNKVLGSLDTGNTSSKSSFLNVGSRSSVDLGTLGNAGGNFNPINSSSSCSSAASSSGHRPSLDLGQPPSHIPPFTAMTTNASPPNEAAAGDQSNNEDFVDETTTSSSSKSVVY